MSAGTGTAEEVRRPLDPEPAPTPTKAPRRRRNGLSARVITIAGCVALIIYCLAPFYWMVVSSLRRTNDIFSTSILPWPLSLDGYEQAFDPDNGFLRGLLNSVLVAGTTTALALVLSIMTSYALARLQFRFKGVALAVIIATSMFPGISLVVPLLKLFVSIDWINTYQAMIIPSLSFVLPLSVFTLTAFFRQMPYELEEAALIDGCTPFQAFRRIILPLAAPGLFTTAIISFISAWNEFTIALSVTNERSIRTATVLIGLFTGSSEYQQPYGAQMAAGVVVSIPLVIMVLIFQRRIVAGLTAGGLK